MMTRKLGRIFLPLTSLPVKGVAQHELAMVEQKRENIHRCSLEVTLGETLNSFSSRQVPDPIAWQSQERKAAYTACHNNTLGVESVDREGPGCPRLALETDWNSTDPWSRNVLHCLTASQFEIHRIERQDISSNYQERTLFFHMCQRLLAGFTVLEGILWLAHSGFQGLQSKFEKARAGTL